MSVLVLLAWSAAITVLVMVLVFGGRVERARHALRRIAGPPVWPVVGNAGSLTPLSVIHENVVSLHRKYGDVFKIIMPGAVKQLVFVRDPVILKHVLSNREFFAQRGPEGDGNTTLLPQGLSSMQTGKQWGIHRRALSPLFSDRMLRAYSVTIGECLAPFLKLLHGKQMQNVEMHSALERLTLDIIGHIGFETDFAAQKDGDKNHFSRAGTALLEEASRRLFQPKIVWKTLECLQAREALQGRQLLRNIVHSASAGSKDTAKTSMLRAVLNAEDPETGKRLTTEEQSDELINMLVAGHESTANMCSWAVHLLATHPDEQAKLHAELDAVLGGQSVTWERTKDLPFLCNVIKETLRLYPTVPVWARYTSRDTTLPGGISVPGNTQVMIANTAVHTNPLYWTDPHEFIPDRFNRSSSHYKPQHPFAYLPFGAGQRSCIGRRLALAEGALIIAAIFQSHTVKPMRGAPQVTARSDITLGPKESGVWVSVTRRANTPHESVARN